MAVRVGSTVAVYCLSDGAQLPPFVSERRRRQLQKSDEALRRRIELLQDFEYEGGMSRRAKFSSDGRFVVTTGEYPPRCKTFEVGQLSMKYERRLRCVCMDVAVLTEDASKLAFLLADRTLDFHAPYGSHYKLRVPSHGRELAYDSPSCLLHVAGADGNVQRLDLAAGRFVSPLETEAGVTRLRFGPSGMPLLAVGGEDGQIRIFDVRTPAGKKAGVVDACAEDVTALAWDPNGLRLAVGSSAAVVKLYDIRLRAPLICKEHQYELPIVDVHFTRSRGGSFKDRQLILSADERLVKAWTPDGDTVFNVETSAKIAQLEVAPLETKAGSDSGLLVCPGEQPRIMTYYVPALGPAPRWCSFLDYLTEELAETESTAFEDFRFVTSKDLDILGASNLIGTSSLKAYMHGYFIEAKLYRKLMAVAEPFAYDNWREQQRQKKKQDKLGSKIRGIVENRKRAAQSTQLPAVNAELAQRLIADAAKTEEATITSVANPLGDDRFAALFTDRNFQIDIDSPDYILRHPNATKRREDNDETTRGVRLRSRTDSNQDDYQPPLQPIRAVARQSRAETRTVDAAAALGLLGDGSQSDNILSTEPLGKRISTSGASDELNATNRVDSEAGLVREFTYVPGGDSSATSKNRVIKRSRGSRR